MAFLLRTVGLAMGVALLFGVLLSRTPEIRARVSARSALSEGARKVRAGDLAGAIAALGDGASKAGGALGRDDAQTLELFRQLGLASQLQFGADSIQAATAFRAACGNQFLLNERTSLSIVAASHSLGVLLARTGGLQEAIFHLRFVAFHRARNLGANSAPALSARKDLSIAFAGQGRLQRAESEMRMALLVQRGSTANEDIDAFEFRRMLALFLCSRFQSGEAISLLKRKLISCPPSPGSHALVDSLRLVESLCINGSPQHTQLLVEHLVASHFLGSTDRKTKELDAKIKFFASLAPPPPEQIEFSWKDRPKDPARKSQRDWGSYAAGLASAGWHLMAVAIWREIQAYETEMHESQWTQSNFDETIARQLKAAGFDREAYPLASRVVAHYQRKWEEDPKHDLTNRWNILNVYRFMGWKTDEEQELRFLLHLVETSALPNWESRLKAQVELAAFLRDGGRYGAALALASEPAVAVRKRPLMNDAENKRWTDLYDDLQMELRFEIPK